MVGTRTLRLRLLETADGAVTAIPRERPYLLHFAGTESNICAPRVRGRDESRGSAPLEGGRPPRVWSEGLSVAEGRCPGRATNASAFVSSSVFALHFTEPPVSAQLLAFLRVFCMTEGK